MKFDDEGIFKMADAGRHGAMLTTAVEQRQDLVHVK
jgi:hypothetical protein